MRGAGRCEAFFQPPAIAIMSPGERFVLVGQSALAPLQLGGLGRLLLFQIV